MEVNSFNTSNKNLDFLASMGDVYLESVNLDIDCIMRQIYYFVQYA